MEEPILFSHLLERCISPNRMLIRPLLIGMQEKLLPITSHHLTKGDTLPSTGEPYLFIQLLFHPFLFCCTTPALSTRMPATKLLGPATLKST